MQPKALGTLDYIRSFLAIALFFLILLIVTPVIVILLIISFGQLTNFIISYFGPIIGRPVLATAGIRFRIVNRDNIPDHPAVFIINHCSTIDLLIILALGLPRVRFVAKYELQYNPLFFILGHMTGQVFIQRQKTDKAVHRLQKSYNRLQRNRLSILAAPEGSRKHEGVIGPFKKGPFRMAMDLDYPIVPIFVDGAWKLSSGGNLLTKKGAVTVYVHPPIEVSDWSLENLEEHIKEIRNSYLQWAGVDQQS